ncbi:hypothetical protein M8J76_007915 [Diaphorina citri]|nr:hypothetical protein M8J75_004412 [Diaphorina citri]KAI5716513.1 hypothetical protein M8J76_007915 [Diaphorina citri]KAI5717359.1 hypothetical protein M8J77_004520 [Diaphorina citri]
MGKNKTRQNVFKVAGSRCLKAKNKAKAVTSQLKKISKNIVQSKTEEINQQLKSLDTIVRQSEPKPKPPTGVKPAAKSNEELVANYESEMKKAEETLDGLASFNVTGDK